MLMHYICISGLRDARHELGRKATVDALHMYKWIERRDYLREDKLNRMHYICISGLREETIFEKIN